MKILKYIPILAMALMVFFSACKDEDDIDVGTTPTIVSTNPQNSQLDVPRNNLVSVSFSVPMDPASINYSSFIVEQGAETIMGLVEYSGVEATFTPSEFFNATESYTATITTSAMSEAGKSIRSNYVWSFKTGGSDQSNEAIDLGASDNFVILSKTAISNSGNSAVIGNLGISPAATSYITGLALTHFLSYATSIQVTGQIFAADMAAPTPLNLTIAVENMLAAYNTAAGRTAVDYFEFATGNIGGKTLASGIYKWTNTVIITADVVIEGTSTDVWIFQIAEDLTMSSAMNITLSGGAKAENIFWQVAGQVIVGTGAHFEGIILSMSGITLQNGATLNGRALAQTAIILDENVVVQP